MMFQLYKSYATDGTIVVKTTESGGVSYAALIKKLSCASAVWTGLLSVLLINFI